MAGRDRRHTAADWLPAVLLLVSDRSKLVEIRRQWRASAPAAEAMSLWATPREHAEWAGARALTHGRGPVLLATSEGATLLFTGFAPSTGSYFIPGYALL